MTTFLACVSRYLLIPGYSRKLADLRTCQCDVFRYKEDKNCNCAVVRNIALAVV